MSVHSTEIWGGWGHKGEEPHGQDSVGESHLLPCAGGGYWTSSVPTGFVCVMDVTALLLEVEE